MKILYIDPCCPKEYTHKTIEEGRSGGTESTVARVTQGLSTRHDVTILQRNRVDTSLDMVAYQPLDGYTGNPDVVITLRDARVYRDAITKYPKAIHYLWMHDVVSGEYQKHLEIELKDHKTNILAVSQFHANQIRNALRDETLKGDLNIQVMYNPVADYCRKGSRDYDPYKLIFFSSPHKGLDQVLQAFKILREREPRYKLHVANPGYYADKEELPEGCVNISGLSHRDLMKEIEGSMCTFYPQTVFEETFGLVYAESNALGTPVLAHDLGAAREVLDNPAQILPHRWDLEYALQTTVRWSNGDRPVVGLNPLFSMGEVIKNWNKLLRYGRP